MHATLKPGDLHSDLARLAIDFAQRVVNAEAIHFYLPSFLNPNTARPALQVWHRSNWHWHLKHERRYPRCPAGAGLAAAGA